MSPFDAGGEAGRPSLSDAAQAVLLLSVDPRLGGMVIRSWSGAPRDELVRRLTALRPQVPVMKMPLNISDDRLLGGLDLGATLAAGHRVMQPGLLQQAENGFLLLAMAERITPGTAAHLAAAMDDDGLTVIALDEGIGPDEAPPAALLDRLAFTIGDLAAAEEIWPGAGVVAKAAAALGGVICPVEAVAQCCALAAMLGVSSTRAELFTCRAARAAAALRGAGSVEDADIALAARLVLAPRATRMPAPPPETPQGEEAAEQQQQQQQQSEALKPMEDRLDEAAQAVLPADLLASLAAPTVMRRTRRGAGTAGRSKSVLRGRPLAARRGALAGGARLSVMDTLRAAAPWQALRQHKPGRIAIRADDFHIRRYREQPRRIAIFAVDASGSSAINRLAEAKGAILRLLADCYVQRDEVALIAFRNASAEILLPPTHALARARRALAALPGGGPTPLAAGISAARQLAAAEQRRGKQALLVLLTDGGANIGQDGKPGRAAAGRDALAAAKACAADRMPALVVDTAPRRQAFVAQLAAAMTARYFALPYADSARLSAAVQAIGFNHA